MDNNNLNVENNYTDGNILKSFKDSVACNENQLLSSNNNALQISLIMTILILVNPLSNKAQKYKMYAF